MLSMHDIRGVCAMPVTPSQPNVTAWDEDNTVELDVSVKMAKDLVDAGVGSFALCGTTGEGWALSLDEKKSFVDTVLQVVGHRVPVFAGATQLGTKATINEMRAFRDLGAEGAFVGLPLWQTPTMENSVRFLADLSEAVPDMPIMLYANSRVFKWDFPTDFWEAVVAKAPTVIACKIAYGTEHLAEDVRLAGHQIRFLPNDRAAVDAYRQVPDHITAIWATSVCMGPEPVVALMDAILARDDQRIGQIDEELKALPPPIPAGQMAAFASYNAQAVKASTNAAGFMDAGTLPCTTQWEHGLVPTRGRRQRRRGAEQPRWWLADRVHRRRPQDA